MAALLLESPLFWLTWLADLADLVAPVLLGWLAAAAVLGLAAHTIGQGVESGPEPEEGAR